LQILTAEVVRPLAGLRAPESEKRDYGHLFIVGGSRSYPGAVLMSVLAALRSGAGLVTAFVPESLVGAFAARAPEAMWVGWPETPAGGLALEGQHLLRERLERADALLIGPGLTREPETSALANEIVKTSSVPLVIDADALQPEIVRAGTARRIVTPHLGELRRILEGDDFYTTRAGREAVVVVKGRLTGITIGGGRAGYYSPFGGPVLARGGSGDLLAGIIGAQLAQSADDPLLAASRGVVWHGMAADALARAHGQVAVHTTQLLDFLPAALRESGACPAS
jgi:NAD(P)H-hydrate epimerase